MPAATRFMSPWQACRISKRKLRPCIEPPTGALPGPTSRPICPTRPPAAWRSIRKTPTRFTWPPTRAFTLHPRSPTAGQCPPIAGRPSAPGFPPPPPWLSAPRPQRLPRTCWSRPPMGAASGKRRSSPQPRPSAPPPSIPPRTPSPTRALIPPAAGSPSLSSTPAASLSHPVPLPSPATSAKPTTA